MKPVSLIERMKRQRAARYVLRNGESKAVKMKRFSNPVGKLKTQLMTPRSVLEEALENAENNKMVVVLSIDKNNVVDFSWSNGALKNLVFIERCFGKAVSEELAVGDD